MLWRDEPPRPEALRAWPHAWKLATVTVCFGAFMGQLDASIVTLTYRPLEHQFHASAAAVQWVSLAYLIALVGLLAPMGRRSDQHGRKLSYLHGFLIFTAGSAACGLAPSLGWLAGARVLQGLGAALLQANSVALISGVAPARRLRTALGGQAAAQALGLALGPTTGGLIVSTLGWRWVFAVNIPVGMVAVVAGIVFLPRTVHRAPAGPLDVRGSLLLGSSTAAGLLAISAAGGLHLGSGLAIACLAAAVGSSVALVRHLHRVAQPVLPPAVIRSPGVVPGLWTAMLTYWTLFGPLVLVPAVLEAHRVSSLSAGLVLTALPAGFAAAATIAGGLLPREWDDRARARLGAGVAVAGLLAATMAPIRIPWVAASLAVVGLGLGLLAPANNAQIMQSVPRESAASAGAVLNMTRALGTALGIAIVTLCAHMGGARVGQASLLVTAGAAWLSVGAHGRRQPGRIMPDHADRPGRVLAGVSHPPVGG